jgi:hypothetical protein
LIVQGKGYRSGDKYVKRLSEILRDQTCTDA